MAEPHEVLIVEDEPVVLKVAGMALVAQGIGFEEAIDVTSATAHLESASFKVVLSDLKLPGESGFEILRLSRQISPSPQVIIITGYATIENALRSFELGSFDFIPKPFDVDELTSVVTRALRFADLPESDTRVAGDRYFLGRHSWAQLDPDGSVTLGVAETLVGVMGRLHAIECVKSGDRTVQGQCFCQMTSVDGLTHRVWAPLSGRIIMHNPDVAEDLELINRDPFAAGWLVRVIPSRLEEELPKISQPEGSLSG